jgi:hypothetical protein
MMNEVSEGDIARIASGHCPVCSYRGFVLGPRGGMSINIECGNVGCRARFNVASAFTHRIVFAQRIPKQSEGGSDWD